MKKLVLLVTALVVFAFVQPVGAASFQDVKKQPWAQDAIQYLSSAGIIHGYDEETFAPANPITRGQVAVMVASALEPNSGEAQQTSGFTDVSGDSYYAKAIDILKNAGVIYGYPDNTFHPNSSITRGEAAVILDNAFNISQADVSNSNQTMTRAEFAVVLAQTLYSETQVSADNQTDQPEGNGSVETSSENETAAGESTTEDAAANEISALEKEVVDLVNNEREYYGLPPLELNPELSRVAHAKSQDMAENNYFDHTSPTYGSPFEMMDDFGITYYSAGENIAAGHQTAEEVVNHWMNSPGHRANILSEYFTEIGVAQVEGGAYGTYWTQMFIGK